MSRVNDLIEEAKRMVASKEYLLLDVSLGVKIRTIAEAKPYNISKKIAKRHESTLNTARQKIAEAKKK